MFLFCLKYKNCYTITWLWGDGLQGELVFEDFHLIVQAVSVEKRRIGAFVSNFSPLVPLLWPKQNTGITFEVLSLTVLR